MNESALIAVAPPDRRPGWAAIASGVIGIAAFALLITAVTTRVTWIPSERFWLLFGTHDVGVAFQFLLLIPALFGLRALSHQSPPGLGKAAFATGKWTLIFVALLVILGMGDKIISDGFYMLPQGIFGAWLMMANWRLSGSLPRWLRWFGMIVGLGLALVGTCFVGLCFVYPTQLYIPQPPMESFKEVYSVANTFWHQLLHFASYVGVATLPLWTLLAGFQLLKERRPTVDF
jgi:hypothetical protein